MGRIIVTTTKVSKIPWIMKETGHPVYSYEELCFYISGRLPLWLLETERKGLADWLFQRGITVSGNDDLPPKEAAKQILLAGNYFRPDETKEILEEITNYEEKPERFREKEKGDLYLSYGKLLKAGLSYQKAAGQMQKEDESGWKASLFHNMGLVFCRFFYWDDARKAFEKAFSYRESDPTWKALLFAKEMGQKEWETGREPVLTIEIEGKKKEFLEELGS